MSYLKIMLYINKNDNNVSHFTMISFVKMFFFVAHLIKALGGWCNGASFLE